MKQHSRGKGRGRGILPKGIVNSPGKKLFQSTSKEVGHLFNNTLIWYQKVYYQE